MENFEKALDLNPDYAEAVTRIGMTKLNSPKYSKVEACLDFEKGKKLGDELANDYLSEFCSK